MSVMPIFLSMYKLIVGPRILLYVCNLIHGLLPLKLDGLHLCHWKTLARARDSSQKDGWPEATWVSEGNLEVGLRGLWGEPCCYLTVIVQGDPRGEVISKSCRGRVYKLRTKRMFSPSPSQMADRRQSDIPPRQCPRRRIEKDHDRGMYP